MNYNNIKKIALFNMLEDFKQAALEGRTTIAELHFQRAVEEIKKSGDLVLLGRAYLNRYAVQTALLESFDDGKFQKIQSVHPDRENAAFLSFLKGNFDRTDSKLLPSPYAAAQNDLLEGNAKQDVHESGSSPCPCRSVHVWIPALQGMRW